MGNKLFTNKISVGILACICAILWGSAFPVLKISFKELNILPIDIYSKLYFAGMRFFISSIILFLIIKFYLKLNIKVDKKKYKSFLLLGLLQTTIMYFFFYNGLGYTSGAKASILMSSSNFFVIIIAHFIYNNDKLNYQKIIGLTTGFLGIILINFNKLPFDTVFTLHGEGFLLFGALSGTFGTFLGKNLTKKIHPVIITAWQIFFGSIILLIIGKIGMGSSTLKFTKLTIGLLLYSSFISATAFSIWFMLLKYNKAGEITIYKFLTPISGSILSIIFLKEEYFSMPILFALLLVSSGIVLININTKNKISNKK
jgi:drug/metabolite transporter (DMT)-like permease